QPPSPPVPCPRYRYHRDLHPCPTRRSSDLVVMTPGGWLYFDHSQSLNEDSVTFGGYNPIEKVYSYEPVPSAIDPTKAKHILGARSEEHTSELQSREQHVCRRLLER